MRPSHIGGLRALHDAIKHIGTCNERESVAKAAVVGLQEALAVADAAVWDLVDGSWRRYTANGEVGAIAVAKPVDVHCVVRRGEALRAEDVFDLVPDALRGWCFAPMEAEGRTLGVLGVEFPAQKLDEARLELLCCIASATAVTLAQLHARDVAVEAERRRLRLSRYLAPQVARYIDRSSRERCPPVRGDATVLFADIRSFTSMSEGHDPVDVFSFLSGYFERMLGIIDEHGGVVDKLLGDGVLAVFGAPDPRPDHASAAVAAAVQMVAAAASIRGRPDGKPTPIRIGVGLHSGALVWGDLGGDAFLEFTIIGSTVNIAARVEEQTKRLGHALLATRATIDRLPPGARPSQSQDVKLQGIEHAVQLFAIEATPP